MQSNNGRSPNGKLRAPAPKRDALRRGVLLVNTGTPSGPDVAAVRRYLIEFLGDPRVIQLPWALRWMQQPLARFIAWSRGPSSAEKYKEIWTDRGSPLRVIMEDQAAALAKLMPDEWSVFVGMRYGEPSIESALRQIAAQDINELVVLPMYPHFSGTTTGTSLDEVYRVLKARALHVNVTTRTSWNADAGYLNAQARLIADAADREQLTWDNAYMVFVAHGLPVSYIERGDPYERQLTESIRLIIERLGWPVNRTLTAYQSRLGPNKWLEPELTNVLTDLAGRGEKRVLLTPISFTADCLETLEELHLRASDHFAALGGELQICPALNVDEHFIQALRDLVLRGPRPVVTWSRRHQPLMRPAEPSEPHDLGLDQLVMVGVSLANAIGSGLGPRLAYSDLADLQCAKKTHEEVKTFLRGLCGDENIREAFVWNTCYRFECYAWLEGKTQLAGRNCLIAALRERLFAPHVADMKINTLFGHNAWHHLMRTLAGLNSGLPGDKDIVAQFQTALEAAEQAGTAGPRAKALIEQTVALSRRVRRETSWGQLDPGYCGAALSRVQRQVPQNFADLRHVVLGSSTTSRSVLHALYEEFDVKESHVTLVYRTHKGAQSKLLRKAAGRGRRLRVHSYDQTAVLAAMREADVLHFGIDREEPVLTAEALVGARPFQERPLYVIDFNTAGSTRGLETLEGVTVWSARRLDAEVEQFAAELCERDAFAEIVQQTEAWIAQQAPPPVPLKLELPCETRDKYGHPRCQRCGRPAAMAESLS